MLKLKKKSRYSFFSRDEITMIKTLHFSIFEFDMSDKIEF